MGRVLVAGLGNRLRGDDGVGLEVAADLASARPDLDVIVHEREPVDLIELWDGVEEAIVVDAVAGDEAGAVHTVEAGPGAGALPRGGAPASSHAMDLAQVIELARALGRMPARLTLIGIEGTSFDTGAEPSPAVLAAGRRVARELARSVPTTERRRGGARIESGPPRA